MTQLCMRAAPRARTRWRQLQLVKCCVVMPSDDTCPVCHTTDLIGGKWTLLLVRDLASGRSRFCELERSLAGISPRTLSLRLRALEEDGIIERHTYPEVPPRVEYSLTQKGLDLLPIIESTSFGSSSRRMRLCVASTRRCAMYGRRRRSSPSTPNVSMRSWMTISTHQKLSQCFRG